MDTHRKKKKSAVLKKAKRMNINKDERLKTIKKGEYKKKKKKKKKRHCEKAEKEDRKDEEKKNGRR